MGGKKGEKSLKWGENLGNPETLYKKPNFLNAGCPCERRKRESG